MVPSKANPQKKKSILYIGGTVPSLSETFVYREIFALADLGYTVHVASVHSPEKALGEDRLDDMADQALVIYGLSPVAMLVDILGELIKRPIQTVVTLLSGIGDALFGDVGSLLGRPKILFQNIMAISLANRVRSLKVDHIHSHMAHVPTTIAMYCAKQLGVEFSFTGHAVDIFKYNTLLKKKLKEASFVSCISKWHREFYRKLLEGDDSHYPIIRCGVDSKWFSIKRNNDSELVEILAVGRLIDKKGFDILISALAEINSNILDNIHCKIVGDGPDREKLEQKIEKAKLTGRVELCGSMNNLEIPKLMESTAVFALPSRISTSGDRDGIPVALMEAMAAGVCVLAGDLPAVRELVIDGKTGVMIEPGSIRSLKDAILDLVEDAEKRVKLAEQGRIHVKNEFSIEENAARVAYSIDRIGN